MEWFNATDWHAVLMPDTPLLEIFVRGSLMYLALFFMLRFMKRQAGEVNVSDLLVIVLIADAAQNGMAGEYTSVADGIVLVATLVFWDYVLDWLGYHSRWFEKLTCPPPVTLVLRGRMQRHNMRKELISEDDLLTQLRQKGVENVKEVKRACMEADGKISVIAYRGRK